MESSEWEEVSLGELRDGDVARVLVTYEGPWDRRYGLMSRSLTSSYRYERKVLKPSPEALRAARSVLVSIYGLGIAEAQPSGGSIERAARVIDKAMRGES